MINNDWNDVLKDYFITEEYAQLLNKINYEYATKTIFPKKENIFKALELCTYKKLKVIILGQDPYHGDDEANGLSFSVQDSVKIPPSLKNIFKELKTDTNISREQTDLSDWAAQGILLLNTIMTVEKDRPLSHKNIGWDDFTDLIIKKTNDKKDPVVFILWGKSAKQKKDLITNPIHKIIESTHPSPFSARNGFFGSKPFTKTNEILIQNNQEPIKW